MKVTLTCNLRCKRKLWRKGTVLSGPPFPPDIAEEIKAVQKGRSDALNIISGEREKRMDDAGMRGSAAGNALRQKLSEEIDRERGIAKAILFRKFDKPILNQFLYQQPEIQFQSTPWFFHQHGAKEKRKLLLRKF